jgi:hypothetical protein
MTAFLVIDPLLKIVRACLGALAVLRGSCARNSDGIDNVAHVQGGCADSEHRAAWMSMKKQFWERLDAGISRQRGCDGFVRRDLRYAKEARPRTSRPFD